MSSVRLHLHAPSYLRTYMSSEKPIYALRKLQEFLENRDGRVGDVWFDGDVPLFHLKFRTRVALKKFLAGQSEMEKKLMTEIMHEIMQSKNIILPQLYRYNTLSNSLHHLHIKVRDDGIHMQRPTSYIWGRGIGHVIIKLLYAIDASSPALMHGIHFYTSMLPTFFDI